MKSSKKPKDHAPINYQACKECNKLKAEIEAEKQNVSYWKDKFQKMKTQRVLQRKMSMQDTLKTLGLKTNESPQGQDEIDRETGKPLGPEDIEEQDNELTIVEKNVMLKVNSKSFRCECGANVFHKYNDGTYGCNGCRAKYSSS